MTKSITATRDTIIVRTLREKLQDCYGSSAEHALGDCSCSVQNEALALIDDLVEALGAHVALISEHRETGVPPIRKMLIHLEKTEALLVKVQS